MSIKGALQGLDKIRAKAESKGGSFDGESPFLTLKDGESYKIRFMQELDDQVESYDARRGSIQVVEEHTGIGPNGYKKRAVCTLEVDGKCWACTQANTISDKEIAKKWKPRMRFYANVLVRGQGDAQDKVKVFAQGFGKTNVGNDIIDASVEYQGLSNQDFKISRRGAGMSDTSYSLMPLPPKAMTKAEKDLDMLDLGKFIKYVPFEDQAAFYTAEDSNGGEKSDW